MPVGEADRLPDHWTLAWPGEEGQQEAAGDKGRLTPDPLAPMLTPDPLVRYLCLHRIH